MANGFVGAVRTAGGCHTQRPVLSLVLRHDCKQSLSHISGHCPAGMRHQAATVAAPPSAAVLYPQGVGYFLFWKLGDEFPVIDNPEQCKSLPSNRS